MNAAWRPRIVRRRDAGGVPKTMRRMAEGDVEPH
ncbi:hypothetical protein LIG30_2032 [Burkholderia sp. lig30]|jgi:hypothetical protein|nr:hypothetical protein LIG30_2032 [Burkholderia sp. lig30]